MKSALLFAYMTLQAKEMIKGISEYADADNLPLQHETINTAQLLYSILNTMSRLCI